MFLHAVSEDSDQSGLGAHSLCWFCHVVAHVSSVVFVSEYMVIRDLVWLRLTRDFISEFNSSTICL